VVTLLQGLAFVAAIVLLALAGMVIVRRSVEVSTLETHNDVAGFIYAVLGVVYAVVLGFVVIVVWEQFNAADQHIHQEAAAIVGVSRLAGSFPEPDRERIRQALHDYTRTVIDQEWASLARGELSRDATARLEGLWQAYRQVEPRTEQEKAAYTESLQVLTAFNELRWQRLFDSREGVPFGMWIVLAAGAALTVAFSYLFGVRNVYAQMAITGTLAAIIAIMLFLIHAIDYPFTGDMQVSPEPFEEALTALEADTDAAPR